MLPNEVLVDALEFLNRKKLCEVQLVGHAMNNIVQKYFRVYPLHQVKTAFYFCEPYAYKREKMKQKRQLTKLYGGCFNGVTFFTAVWSSTIVFKLLGKWKLPPYLRCKDVYVSNLTNYKDMDQLKCLGTLLQGQESSLVVCKFEQCGYVSKECLERLFTDCAPPPCAKVQIYPGCFPDLNDRSLLALLPKFQSLEVFCDSAKKKLITTDDLINWYASGNGYILGVDKCLIDGDIDGLAQRCYQKFLDTDGQFFIRFLCCISSVADNDVASVPRTRQLQQMLKDHPERAIRRKQSFVVCFPAQKDPNLATVVLISTFASK
jgi:hypothetical protein